MDSSATPRVRMEARQKFAQVLFEAAFEESDWQETVMKFLDEALRHRSPTNVNLAELRTQPPKRHVRESGGQAD
jgi:hypothetical protein